MPRHLWEKRGAQEREVDTLDCSGASENVRANYAPLNDKGKISGLPNQYPIIVAEWDRNKREVVRVALDHYNGRHTISVRVWYRDGDELRPSKSGITLGFKHLGPLASALNNACDLAVRLGMIDEGEQ